MFDAGGVGISTLLPLLFATSLLLKVIAKRSNYILSVDFIEFYIACHFYHA